MIKTMWIGVASGLLALGLAGCGVSSDNDPVAQEVGVIVDDPVQGLRYSSASGSGVTDRDGQFSFAAGETVSFSLAGQPLGSAAGSAVLVISELLGVAPDGNLLPDDVINLARLLQSLDIDNDLSNGIRLPPAAQALSIPPIRFDMSFSQFASQQGVQELLAAANNAVLVSDVSARNALQRTIDHIRQNGGRPNRLPRAVIQPGDTTLAEGQQLQFSGAGSTDSDGSVVGYQWTEVTNVGLVLDNDGTQRVTVTAPNVSQTTEALLVLWVVDNDGGTDSTSITITVTDGAITSNNPPVAAAGPDQTIGEDETGTLDGTASSDPEDGAVASYLWTEVTSLGITLDNPRGSRPNFVTPQVNTTTTARMRLTVTDSVGATDSDEMRITISNTIDNIQPEAVASATPTTVTSGQTVSLDGRGSTDQDGNVVSWRWTNVTNGVVVNIDNSNAAQASFVAPQVGANTVQLVSIQLEVRDNQNGRDSDTVQVSVRGTAGNGVPVANAGLDQQVDEGSSVILDASASTDPDNDTLSYSWSQATGTPTVQLTGADTAQASFTAPEVDEDTVLGFVVVVSDAAGASSQDEVLVTVANTGGAVGEAPTASADISPTDPAPGATVTLDGSASTDPEGGDLIYAWSEDAASSCALSITDADTVTATTTAPTTPGVTCTVRLQVTDPEGLSDETTGSFSVPSSTVETFSFEECLEMDSPFTACQERFDDCYSQGAPPTGETDPQVCFTRAVCDLERTFDESDAAICAGLSGGGDDGVALCGPDQAPDPISGECLPTCAPDEAPQIGGECLPI